MQLLQRMLMNYDAPKQLLQSTLVPRFDNTSTGSIYECKSVNVLQYGLDVIYGLGQ